MGVEDSFQMTLVKNQVQSVESINNIALIVNFFTRVFCSQEKCEDKILSHTIPDWTNPIMFWSLGLQ